MMKAGNQTLLKKTNQRAITDYIIHNGPISRADLSKTLNISKPTVSANVSDLIDMGLLKEIGYTETDIGKRPMMIDFCKDVKYVLALDFISYMARYKISVSVCNLYCEPIFTDTITLPFGYGSSVIKDDVPKALRALFEKNNIDTDKIERLVLTAPTAWYDDEHVPLKCANGEVVNLAEGFLPLFKGKISVKNDINLAALGEKYFGVGKNVDTLAFFWIGLFVGGGIIINGELYEGHNMIGGELAYSVTYNESSHEYEYFQDITSNDGIKRYIQLNLEQAKKSSISQNLLDGSFCLDKIMDAALEGDEFCTEFGRFIGKISALHITNICNTMDLQMAIVGGEYTKFGDVFFDEIHKTVSANPLTKAQITTPCHTTSAMFGAFKIGAESIIAELI